MTLTEIKELIELDLLVQIMDSAESADRTSVNGIVVIEGTNGKKYNLDKMKKRCDYLFDKIMEQYLVKN